MNSNIATIESETTDGARYCTPKADFRSSPEGTQVLLDVPGVTHEGLEITVEEQRLTIRGRRKQSEPVGDWLHQEIVPYDYRRVFTLASSIDTAKIEAELRDGVLRLHLPLSEKVKPRRLKVS